VHESESESSRATGGTPESLADCLAISTAEHHHWAIGAIMSLKAEIP